MVVTKPSGLSLSILLILALIVAGCGAQTAPTPVPAEPLRIGYNQWAGYGAVTIASEKGLFKQAGVNVELVLYASLDVANSDFAAQKLDGNLSTLTDGVALAANGLPVEVIWICDNSSGGDVLISSKGITDIKTLKGKKVGLNFGTFGHLFVLKGLANAGLTPSDVSVINVRGEDVPKALANGEIDAGHTWDPFLAQALKDGGNVLFTSAETPGVIVDNLLIRSDVVQKRANEVKALVKAIAEAEVWWRANPDEGNKIIAKAIGVAPEEMPAILAGIKVFSLKDNLEAFKPADQNPQGMAASVQSNIDFFVTQKIIKQAVDVTSFTNGSFVQAAAQK
jgi:NitT/TauT family transport system substrate-binding protein